MELALELVGPVEFGVIAWGSETEIVLFVVKVRGAGSNS